MKPRNQIHLAIALGCIALALVWPVHELRAKPMVECRDGKCVMDEADYRRLQEFHAETRKQMDRINESIENHNKAYVGLMGQLAACQSRQPQREV